MGSKGQTIPLAISSISNQLAREIFFSYVYLFILRETESEREREREREREGRRESQAGSVLSAQSPTQGSIPYKARSCSELDAYPTGLPRLPKGYF